MTLKKLADEAVAELQTALSGVAVSEELKQQMSKIVERTLIKTVQQTGQAHRTATQACCGAEADLAHKINEQVERANVALIANLMALR